MENTTTGNPPITIALDAMGGDFAPEMAVKGAVLAAREHNVKVILVGDEEAIKAEIIKNDAVDLPFDIRHAPQVIGMGEKPQAMIRKKKKASLRIAFEMVKNNEAQGIVSAGNSGAVLYGALFVGTIDNLLRPYLLSRQSNLPISVSIIGTIGGLYFFGILGLIFGPLIFAYALIIIEFYRKGKLDELFRK